QQSYPPVSWIPGIGVGTQPIDEAMTETTDDGMTQIRTLPAGRRRGSRTIKATPMDPRRAPENVADPTPGGRETALVSEASTLDGAVSRPAGTGIAAGVAAIRDALRSVPATPGVYRMLDRKGDA